MAEAREEKTLGQRIDELLAPYLRDQAELQERLERDLSQRQKLDAQIQATRRDLQIVEQSMVEALRAAAAKDPLLAAAFSSIDRREAPPATAAAPTSTAPPRPLRSHPLLNPTA